MHDHIARILIEQQRDCILNSLEQQENEHLAKGFTSIMGLPVVISVLLDVFQVPDLLEYFIHPMEWLNKLKDRLGELISSEFSVPLQQLIVRFVYKNCPANNLYSYFGV